MPSTEEREAQPVLEEPCPACGSPVVLRYWKGRFSARCKNPGCSFGFDADGRGNPVARCGVCGSGRMRTTGGQQVCADCGAEGGPGAAGERPGGTSSPASGLGVCPKCGKGQLAVRSGSYGTFVSCSERCGLTYSSDDQGVPEGGTCKACQGPVRKTQKGSRVCAVCGAWQEEKGPASRGPATRGPAMEGAAGKDPAGKVPDGAPPRPKAARCPRCSQPLREVFTKRQTWVYRCDPCKAWFDC
jgi:ssDNA-binding Zn-finger/Zn-ribbon topoisomerase 1